MSESEEDQESEPTDGVDDDESDRSYDSAAGDDLHDIEIYEEAMRWAREKEAEAIAQEQKLTADLQAGKSTSLEPLEGRWNLSSEHFYSGEGSFDTLFFGEPSDSDLEEYGEPQASSKLAGHLQLRPKGEPLCSLVAPF